MNGFHFVEFMDLDWVPRSLRDTLRDISEIANGKPFRGYYPWLAAIVEKSVLKTSSERIIELGAGSAPVTRHLLKANLPDHVPLIVTDIHPNTEAYQALTRAYPQRVFPQWQPVDFSSERNWPAKSTLILSTTFHHIPPDQRRKVLENLLDSGAHVMIFEAISRNVASTLLCLFGGLGAGLIAPFFLLSRPGRLRRALWCWFLPFAPLVYSLDGVTSTLRCWNKRECNGSP